MKKTASILKKLVKEERKGKNVINYYKFIKYLARKMIHLHKISNQYEIKIFVRLIFLNLLISLKEIRKIAIKAIDSIKKNKKKNDELVNSITTNILYSFILEKIRKCSHGNYFKYESDGDDFLKDFL